MNFSLGLRV